MEEYMNKETGKTTSAGIRHGIDVANLDTEVSPKVDFYKYACGGWQRRHPIPPEFASYGTFSVLSENARKQLKELILNLQHHPDVGIKDTEAQKVSDLYALGMDEERLNREGASPLSQILQRLWHFDMSELPSLIAWLHLGLSSVFFGSGVGPDAKDSDMNVMHLAEAGLGLGDRDYYIEDNETNRRIMDAYRVYVKRMMELIGYDAQAQERVWENVIAVETDFARHKMTREQHRDPLLRYNMMSLAELKDNYPSFDWDAYFKGIGVIPDKVNVMSTDFYGFLNDYLPSLSRQRIEDYLVYSFVSDSSGVLSDDFSEANFELYGRVMSGTEEQRPRWKRAMGLTNSILGEAVGKLYVEKYFPPCNKEYMLRLVENLRKALAVHIEDLSWMSRPTKDLALEKLDALKVKIGYPDKWKDYSGIHINPDDSYMENVRRASVWFAEDNYKKCGKPVDKSEWHMTPQTVNAYYSPLNNEICFPAGILQPPYFDLAADDAVNYGAIGVVIGHEMTHGFDDQGRHFDKDGNLNEWWQPEDAEEFNKLADGLVAQFDAVEVAPGVHANGRYTLGENIADQGGLRVALTAYESMAGNEDDHVADGYSPLQRFYLSYAGVWADNIREEEILERTKTDPHSLGRNRVNVTLRNIAPFFDAFSISEGDPMFRPQDERVIIW